LRDKTSRVEITSCPANYHAAQKNEKTVLVVFSASLKGLSHEMDLAFVDMYSYLYVLIGYGAMFKIFRFPNDFITQKVYFSQLMRGTLA
jgi:hypothetical protein